MSKNLRMLLCIMMLMIGISVSAQDDFYKAIPADVDVLITHQPPHMILDFDDNFNYGSELLSKRVEEIAPRAHLFGHIHRQNGVLTQGNTIFSNAAIMNESYDSINTPNLIEI